MRRALLIGLAVVVGSIFVAPAAMAANPACSTGTVLSSTDGVGSNLCDVTLSVTVPSAATLTFTSVPSTDFGTVLPGATSSPISITYTIATNTGSTVALDVTHSGTSANQALFEYKQNGGSYCNLDSSCSGVISSALSAGSHTDQVRAVIPGGHAAGGPFTATLTYQITG